MNRARKTAATIWTRLTWIAGRTDPLPSASTSLLLLRLENTDVLTDHLGKAGMAHLVVSLCSRLGRATRPGDPVQIPAQGLFAIWLEDRCELAAMRFACRLHQQAAAAIAVSGRTVVPVLTGVVLHWPDTPRPGAAAMIAAAQGQLQQLPPVDLGAVSLHVCPRGLTTQPMQASIKDAAESGQIVAVFQPQISCHTGCVTGFEALARWQHPVRGLLSPATFMPLMTLEDHGALTLTMLRQSLAALKYWDARGMDVPQVSINVSDSELAQPGFAASLLWELDRQEVPTARLVIEVLESVGPVTANAHALDNLRRLSQAGCMLDLDDFGTGYASLDAIRQFGVQRIKIDRSFVTGCDIDPGQQRMVLAILALAERLGITALAEGVETRDEHAFLAQIGCDEVQGYAIARPMPLTDTLAFLSRHRDRNGRLPRLGRSTAI